MQSRAGSYALIKSTKLEYTAIVILKYRAKVMSKFNLHNSPILIRFDVNVDLRFEIYYGR